MYFNFKVFRETFPRAYSIIFWILSGIVVVFGIAALIGMVMGIVKTIER